MAPGTGYPGAAIRSARIRCQACRSGSKYAGDSGDSARMNGVMAAGLPDLPEGSGFKWFALANFDAIDAGVARAFVSQLDEALNGLSIALDVSLHAAVCTVAYPADKPELGRGLFRPGTKPHALDTPVNIKVTADGHDADYTRNRSRLSQGLRRRRRRAGAGAML